MDHLKFVSIAGQQHASSKETPQPNPLNKGSQIGFECIRMINKIRNHEILLDFKLGELYLHFMNWFCSITTIAIFSLTISSHGAVIFNFVDSGIGDATDSLDPGGVGASFTATNGSDTVTLTTLDIQFPEYINTGNGISSTGNTLSAAAGDAGTTNINGNADALGLNNPSVTNTEYDLLNSGNGTESNDFDFQENWIFSLSQGARIDQIELEENVDIPAELILTIGSNSPQAFDISAIGDLLNDPLSGLFITAGTSISIAAGGDIETNFRIRSITVSVPEPSMLGIVAIGIFIVLLSRRKRILTYPIQTAQYLTLSSENRKPIAITPIFVGQLVACQNAIGDYSSRSSTPSSRSS